jgi:hypothetical protein
MLTKIKRQDDNARAALDVVLVAVMYLVTALWLVAFMAGGITRLGNVLRPYIPSWLLLANLLSVPITMALGQLRAVSFRASFFISPIFIAQMSLIGLSGEDYPLLKGIVMAFLFYESYILIPKWNRRSLDAQKGHTVLGIEEK